MQCFISCADESNTYVKLTTVYSCVHLRANHSLYMSMCYHSSRGESNMVLS